MSLFIFIAFFSIIPLFHILFLYFFSQRICFRGWSLILILILYLGNWSSLLLMSICIYFNEPFWIFFLLYFLCFQLISHLYIRESLKFSNSTLGFHWLCYFLNYLFLDHSLSTGEKELHLIIFLLFFYEKSWDSCSKQLIYCLFYSSGTN